MEIDNSANATQRKIEEKKKQQAKEEAEATNTINRQKRVNSRALNELQEDYDRDFVKISKAHEGQVKKLKDQNGQALESVGKVQEDRMLKIATDMADRFKTLSEDAASK